MNKVSVVLPVYNGQHNIEEAIKSILNQTYKELHLIIVDDCSTDATPSILKRYAEQDQRIKVIKNEKNLKLPASLNRGFCNADAGFWTWTSDDNIYREDAIQKMVTFLEDHEQYGLVYCDTILIDHKGVLIKENPLLEPEELIYGNTVGACFMYRSEVARKVGKYATNLFLAEDYDYWLRMYQQVQIFHIKQGLYFYRCHKKSLSSTRLEDVKKQTAKVWEKHFDFIVEKSQKKEKLFRFFDLLLEYSEIEQQLIIIKRISKVHLLYVLSRSRRLLCQNVKKRLN